MSDKLVEGDGGLINYDTTVTETSLLRTGETGDVQLEMDSVQNGEVCKTTKDAVSLVSKLVVGSVLTVHGVSYGVDVRGRCCRKTTRKHILNDIQ